MSPRPDHDDRDDRGDDESEETRFPRWRLALGGALLFILLASPLWAPRALRHLAFFRVRKIEVNGLRYTPAADVLARLRVDTTRSVWDPLDPLAARVMTHPQIESVVVSRKLPGTLVVEVTERRPVALVPVGAELRAVDERGVLLPLDPSRTPVDAPVVTAPRDLRVYHLLGRMQRESPRLYARISSIRPAGSGELLLQVADVPVRTLTSVTLARLSDIEPVERDLARRQLRAAELDLRYRDQVIARLP
jgi:cell division protein FtsQ